MPLDTAAILDAATPHDLHVRVAILIAALVIDSLVGDPQWLWGRIPHPVVLFGWAITGLERVFNRPRLVGIRLTGKLRRGLGVLVILLLVSIAFAIGSGISIVASSVGGLNLSIVVELLLVSILLAGRSLANHAKAVANTLENGTINEARSAVSRIVGRNTKALDRSAVGRAAIESIAENLSDAVIAPALYYLAFGLSGIFAYKMINTSDSMVGYRSAHRYSYGWGAARFDDLANLIPARFSGLLIALTVPEKMRRALVVMLRDAPHQSSPNAGWPEAAMAVQLNISLSGPRGFGQKRSGGSIINRDALRTIEPSDITYAVKLMWRVVLIFAFIAGMFAVLHSK